MQQACDALFGDASAERAFGSLTSSSAAVACTSASTLQSVVKQQALYVDCMAQNTVTAICSNFEIRRMFESEKHHIYFTRLRQLDMQFIE